MMVSSPPIVARFTRMVVLALFVAGCGGRADQAGGSPNDDPRDAAQQLDVGSHPFDAAPRPFDAGRAEAMSRTPVDAIPDGSPRDAIEGAPSDARPGAPIVTALAIVPATSTVRVGGVVVLTVTATYSNGTTVDVSDRASYIPSSDSIVALDGRVATAKAAGVAKITAALDGVLATASITVNAEPRTIVSIAVTAELSSCNTTDELAFRAVARTSEGLVVDVTYQARWTSSNMSVVFRTGNLASCRSPGPAVISATLDGVHGELPFDVYGPKLRGYILHGPAVVSPRSYATFYLEQVYEDGQMSLLDGSEVTFASSDRAVLDILGEGRGLAFSPGSVVLTASLAGTAVANLKVVVSTATLQSIAITPAALEITYPSVGQLTATATYSDGSRADVTTSFDWVANGGVSVFDGIVRGNESGTTLVSVQSPEGLISPPVAATVLPGQPVDVSIDDLTIPQQLSATPVARARYANGNILDVSRSVAWATADASIAAVMGSLLVGVRPGVTTYSATLGALTSNTRRVIVADVTILSIEFAMTHLTLPVGQMASMSVLATFEDGSQQDVTNAATFATGNQQIAKVGNDASQRGVVTGVRAGTTSLTALVGAQSTTTTVSVY